MEHFGVMSVLLQKFFVRSLFHAVPAVQYDDLIRVPCYFQAMSNENEGAVHRFEVIDYPVLELVVEGVWSLRP